MGCTKTHIVSHFSCSNFELFTYSVVSKALGGKLSDLLYRSALFFFFFFSDIVRLREVW